MAFEISFPTRHTDTFAATAFVHAGVLLALTETAYAAFETHSGLSKPEHIVSVQRETRAQYHTPLHWREGVTITVTTTTASERGFTQEFRVTSGADGRAIATFTHDWIWMDTTAGKRVPLSAETQAALLAG